MPELPEVETIKIGLAGKVPGKKIRAIWIEPSFKKKISPSAGKFLRFLNGKKFTRVKRRAKILVFELNFDYSILVHLKMTGQLVYYPKKGKALTGGHPIKGHENQPDRFARVIFQFTDGAQLYYNDVRKFGYLKLIKNQDIEKEFAEFGPEPFDKEFSQAYFNDLLEKNKNKKIKSILLEQNLIAGLGNIYTDEALHRAKLHPLRSSNTISEEEAGQLLVAIRNVLQEGIQRNGASIDWVYRGGDFQNYFCVYQRTGEACPVCGTTIERIMVGQRGTHLCPQCQKINGPLMQSKKG